MSSSPPPVKVPFSVRRDREFLYLQEVDALIAATENILLVTRNRLKSSCCPSGQITVNLQPLCPPEIDILQKLHTQRTTDWVFASERKQRLSGICQNWELDLAARDHFW